MKKILFLGRGVIGKRCLDLLLRRAGNSYAVAAICSNRGVDVWWGSNAIYKKAIKLGIPFVSNEKKNEDEILALIKSESIDILISVQHLWILSEKILAAVRYQAFNLHNAKLPDYKGYYTLNHAIINGEPTYTSTIHWMDKEVDRGGVAFEESVPVADNDTAIGLYKKSCDAGTRAFEKLIRYLVEDKKIPRLDTQGQGRFYTRADLDKVREVKDPRDATEMNLKARGLFFPPFEPAFYHTDGKKIYVLPENYAALVKNLAFLNQFDKTGQKHFGHVVAPTPLKEKRHKSKR